MSDVSRAHGAQLPIDDQNVYLSNTQRPSSVLVLIVQPGQGRMATEPKTTRTKN